MIRPIQIIAAFASCLVLSGCGSLWGRAPEPQIVVKEVQVAVPVPCKVTVNNRPALKGKDEIRSALFSAPNVDSKVQILLDQLLLYIGWVPVVEAGLEGCGGTVNGNR